VIVVGSINQNITFAQPTGKTYGSSSFSLGATASSGLTVEYELGAGTTGFGTGGVVCSVSTLGVVTLLDVGTCEVVAVQDGDLQYAAASDVTRAFVISSALPTAPSLTSASASSQSITIGFSAPGFTGAPSVSISGYQIEATPTGGGTVVRSTSCTTSPCTITGLTNGVEYTVTIAAINVAGTGPASGASTALTPATAAFAVGSLAATPGNTTVDLTWTALSNDQLGGGTFTRYEVSQRVAGSSPWTLVTSALTVQSTNSYTVSGLDNGTSYDFQVVAITSANASDIPGNTAQVVQYPSTVPSAPRSLTVLALTATDVQFSWVAPLSDGGSVLTTPNYSVSVTTTAAGATSPITCTFAVSTDRFCSASGLSNSALYTFSVVANNRMGASVAATTTYSVPSSDASLSDLVLTSSSGVVSLSPTFASGTTTYSASVNNDVSSVTVTPTSSDPGATIDVDGVTVVSGVASTAISLAVGVNTISIIVTASDPRSTETTTLTITRAEPAPVPSGGGGRVGPSRPSDLEPMTPPLPVANGSVISAVTVNGDMVPTVMRPADTDNGWVAIGSDFSFEVITEKQNGAAEPLTSSGIMQVPQGGRIIVEGDGYLAGSSVNTYLVPREVTSGVQLLARAATSIMYLGTANVNESGFISSTFLVPIGMSVGDYVLQINGITEADEVRSINLATNVIAGSKPVTYKAGLVQRAAFFDGYSTSISSDGERKLRQMVKALPKNATAVQVQIVGVSVSLNTLSENLKLAQKRATTLAEYFTDAGIKGTFTVTVSTTFTTANADGAERAVRSIEPVNGGDGKPLTTATILYQTPTST